MTSVAPGSPVTPRTDAAARDAVKVTFLAAAGWAGAQWTPLAGDASARRYDRVRGPGGRRAVLMDAPASRGEDVRPFWALTLWLRGEGLSAPAILAGDAAAGFLLLEDLGDALYGRVAAADPAAEFPIYAAAIDLLAALPRRPVPAALPWPGGLHPVPPYDRAALWREASLVTDWYLPGATGRPTPPDLALAYEAAIAEACAAVEGARACIALRDYHADNLLWLPERRGLARVGLLDYQDALRGHPAYDLVSLLEDARRDTTPELREAMIRRYLAASGAPEDAFRAAYAALGAQRNLKIIGIFARLWRRDGKPAYLDLIPRVWAHLMNDLAHPALAPLERLVRAHIPPPEPDVLARLRAAGSGTP